jgi:hypothetical protein
MFKSLMCWLNGNQPLPNKANAGDADKAGALRARLSQPLTPAVRLRNAPKQKGNRKDEFK